MTKPTLPKPSSVELGDIFRRLVGQHHGLSPDQMHAFANIAACRTASMGGHVWECSACKHEVPMYNSCLNRHCPKCQAHARYKWVEAKMKDLVNTNYFHVVFTIPHVLNPLVALNPKPLLGLLFRAVSQTLLQFGRDPQHLGGKMGFLSVLHTWNQKLERHYHIHCIVPGGALNVEEHCWIPCRSSKYLFAVKALGKTFRRLFWHGTMTPEGAQPLIGKVIPFKGLCQLLDEGSLKLPTRIANTSWDSRDLAKPLFKHNWNVYCKAPFAGPEQVLKYLGSYTHRVAISNNRILALKNDMVTFAYKKRRKDGPAENRTMTLPIGRFADRFLQHILPSGFMKIRSYGFLASRIKKESLTLIRELLGEFELRDDPQEGESSSAEDEETELPEGPHPVCPKCSKPTLETVLRIPKPTQKQIHILFWNTS
jgi:hypothetical protein